MTGHELGLEYEPKDLIYQQYPTLVLPPSLNCLDDISAVRMSTNERFFALLLMDRGLLVFREPRILQCNHVPDFFVFNPFCKDGKLVEITLLPRNASIGKYSEESISRKQRQVADFLGCGVPCVVLYREELARIRESCCAELF